MTSRRLAWLPLFALLLVACAGPARVRAPKATHEDPDVAAAVAALEREDCAAAKARAHAALDRKPFAEAHHVLGRCAELEGAVDEAIARYRMALKTSPGHEESAVELANLLLDVGREDEAAHVAHAALKHVPDAPELHLVLGTFHERRGDHGAARDAFARAAKAFEAAAAKAPGDAKLRARWGSALSIVGEDDKAKSVWAEAMELAGDDPEIASEVAAGLARIGDAAGCVKSLGRPLARDDLSAKVRARLLRDRAACRFQAKDVAGARADAHASLALEQNLELHLVVARWDEMSGDRKGCAEHYEAAAKIAPGSKVAEEAHLAASRCK